ncbi:hypothetical protein HNR45_001293 [Negativicoccus succinicivorans]|uniref:Phage MuF C-terminal domain-containing protein n=1 Tax=Negativicoccus succinicivorans TaxID=620903 RepID=A0A841R359_9FIRM|nr:hypothetical protein [Negativicoccus succinicivorans]MBB6478223.1 hypothetical protein [Negativicoccus succinicivorans]
MDNREERQKQADAAFRSSGFGMPKIAPSPIQQEADAAASLVNAKPVEQAPTLWEQVRDSEIGRSYFWGKEDYSRRAKEIADRLQVSPDVVSIAGEESLKRWENTFQTLEMGKRDDEFAQTWSDWNDISQTERAIRVHNYSDVKQTMGVVDNVMSGIRQMDAQIKLSAMGNERMELEAKGANTDELDAKIQNLQKYIMSQSGDGGIIHDTSSQLYMMANQSVNSGKEIMIGSLMGAAAGAAAGGVSAIPGFITGAGLGYRAGLFNRMNEMERGLSYLEYRSGGEYGKMSAETAAKAATAVGITNAAIEFASFGMGLRALSMGARKIAGRTAATGAQSIIRNAARSIASARSVGEAGKIFAKSAGIGVASETAEEVAQQAVQDVAWNVAADPSEGTRKMPVTEIISNAVDAGITAAPTILGMSVVLGMGANVRFISKAARMLRPDYEIQKEMAVHTVGAQMLRDLEADKQTSALFKKDPELYTKSVQEAADKQGLGAFFVDANALMETEGGRDILNRMVSGNVVSEQALQTAIETEGRLEVPVGVYLQEDFTEQERAAVDKASAWTQDGTTQAEIAAHWENMAASKYAQELQDDIDRMINATDRVLSDKFSAADEADKETIRQVLVANPLDLGAARKTVRKGIIDNIEQEFADQLNSMRKDLADGAIELVPGRDSVYDQDRMLRMSSNPQWYKDFYATYKRKPRADEFYRIMLDEEEKEVQYFRSSGVIKSEQEYEDALQQIENGRKMVDALNTIDAYKDTFDELQKEKAVSLRMYLSPDEMKVYDDVKKYMDNVGGDAQESAHQAAYLWAKRAKVFTQMMHDMGHTDFVATDYLDMHPLFTMNEYTPDAADKMAAQLMQRNGGIAPREYFQNRYGEGGYDGNSMSNRARAAYDLGEKPMSKWTKDEIIEAVEDYLDETEAETAISVDEIKALPAWLLRQEFLTYRSWHHTGAFYNATDFYGLDFKALDLPLAHYQEKIEEHKKELAATKGDREKERQQREARRERREFETRIKELRKYTKYKTDKGLIAAVDDGRVTLEELEQKEQEEKAKGYLRYTDYKTEKALIKALRNGDITMDKLETLRDEKDPKRIAARKLAKAQGKKEWLEVVANDPALFHLLPEQARNDKDVALLAVRRYGLGALSDVGEALKNDPDFIVGAVCRNAGVLSQFAPALLKNNCSLLRRVVVEAPRAAGQLHNILSEKGRLEFITDVAKDAPAAVASFLSKEQGLSPEEVERIFRSSPKAAELIANDDINHYKKDARGYMERYQAVAREFLKAESRIEYFQTAWHGSPRSFDRFDTNAVGTGTGRKAHGWGLYFAQEQGAAKQYQDKAARRVAKKAGEKPSSSGSLLKVDIPENEVLLDEDKPLNEQPEAVRKAIAAYYQSRPDSYIAATADDLGANIGEYFLHDVVAQMQREGEEEPKKAASLLLRKFGIEGITYKDNRDGRCFVIFSDQAVRVLERNGQAVGEMYQDGKAESGIEYFQADAQRGQEYWQVNEDVDPNETLHVVDITKAVQGGEKLSRKQLKDELLSTFRGLKGLIFVTADENKVVLDAKRARHVAFSPAHLNKTGRQIKHTLPHWIWDVMVHSRRIESAENRKKSKKPKAQRYHRFYGAVKAGENIYPIRLVVEERNEKAVIQDAELLLYDVIPEREKRQQSGLSEHYPTLVPASATVSKVKISDLLRGVKDADGKAYYQQKRHVRGMTALRDGRQMLFLFRKDANFSTFVHESGHVFLEDLQQMAAQENAPEWLKKDWQTVKEWTGWKDGADNRAAHEKWARGFEAYVREGNAPSRDLKAVFRRFRRWLVGIYQNLLDLGEIPPESIRNVMDRMLATQEEIDAYTAEKALDTMQDVDTKLAARLVKLKARAAETVEKKVEEKIRKGVEEMLEDAIQSWRTARTEELQKEEIYKHEALAKQFGEDVLSKYYADAAAFKKALEDAGGPMEERLKREEQEQRKAFTDELMNPESIRAQVEEYMTGELGQADLLEAETRYIARERNKLAGEYMKQLRKLDSRQQTDEQTEAERLAEVLSYLRSELKEHEGARESVKDAQKQLSKMRQQERAAEQELEREQTLVARLKESHAEDAEEHAQKLVEMRQKLTDIRKENAAKVQAIKKTAREEINTRLQGLRDVRDSTQGRLRLIEEQAAQTLRQAPIGESLTWKTYQRKIAYYGTLSSKALVRGDYAQAAEMKERQLYHAYLAKHAVMQEQQVDKDIRRLRENLKRMTRSQQPIRLDTQARYFVHHLMYQLGLTGTDAQAPIDGFEMSSIEELLNPDMAFGMGGDPVISPALRAMFAADGRNEKTWRQMPFETWEETVQVLQAVYTAGRRMHDGLAIVRKNGEHVSIADAANELALKLKKRYGEDNRDLRQIRNDMTRADRMGQLAGELVTQLIKPEIIMNRLDGRAVGVKIDDDSFHRFIYDPIARAATRKREMTADAKRNLSRIFERRYSRNEMRTMRQERKYQVGNRKAYTKEEILTAALNWGAAENRKRVLHTFGVDEATMSAAFGEILTAKDWDTVEKIWEFIDGYYEERSRVLERETGVPLGKVEAVPFTINGRKFEGGYYPIVYDPQLSQKASDMDVANELAKQMSSNAVFGAGLGATKKRQAVVNRELLLSLDVLPRAVNEAILHISMREAVLDVAHLLDHAALAEPLQKVIGQSQYRMLREWVRDTWREELVRESSAEQFANLLRRNATFSVMAYRTTTALLNICNIDMVHQALGHRRTWLALLKFIRHPQRITRKVKEKSSFIAEREENLDRDLARDMKVSGKELSYVGTKGVVAKAAEGVYSAKEAVDRFGYYLITKTDLMLSLPTWQAVYEDTVRAEMERGELTAEQIDAEAIAKADEAVRRIWGSGEIQDQAKVQKGRIMKFFTPFYTFFSVVLNAQIEAGYAFKDTGNPVPLMSTVLYWLFLQTLRETLLRGVVDALTGRGPDDDDDRKEYFGKEYLKNFVGTATGGIPGVNIAATLTMNTMLGEYYQGRGSQVVALRVMDELQDLAYAVGSDKRDWIDIGRSTSRVGNRLVGFSDTLTDGFWTLLRVTCTESDATWDEAVADIIFDRKARKAK